MNLEVDRVLLNKLKDWLRTSKYPGDFVRMAKTVGILNRLSVEVSEVERQEIRELLRDVFEVGEEHLNAAMPSASVDAPTVTTTRRPMPKLNGYVNNYLRLTANQESPDSFHVFALATCLGAALGRRVRLDLTWFKVWPNLSVVLTGPAGGPRKTTACDMAHGVVKSTFRGWVRRPIMDATPPAMVEDLGTTGQSDSIGFIFAPEFRNFLPNQQFMEGTVPLITRLLDNPDFHNVSRILRKGGALRNVTLSILGGSTLDWLAKLPQDAQGGGFLTRVLIVHEERPKPPVPLPARGKGLISARVSWALRRVESYSGGTVKLSPEAEKWFDDFYRKLREAKNIHPKLILYYNRKQTTLLRLALLFALPKRVLSKEDLEAADALLSWVEEPLPDVYRIIGMSKAGEYTKAVLDTIRAFGGKMSWAQISREMKGLLNARDFRMAVDTLKGAGQIVEINTSGEHVLILRELNLVE